MSHDVEVLKAIAYVVIAVAVLVMSIWMLWHGRRMAVGFRDLQMTVDSQVVQPIKQINNAVNHRTHGEPTLVAQIQQMDVKLDEQIKVTESRHRETIAWQADVVRQLGISVNLERTPS